MLAQRTLGHGGVPTAERTSCAESPSAREPLVDVEAAHTCEVRVLDIALVSGHTGTVNHDVVCGLLTRCLQDVSATMLVWPFCLFVTCPLMFNYFFP
jgi:hypothetical protein